jgi:integrase
MIRRVAAIANVSNAHPHRFRRTFAVNYMRNGGDAYTLRRIMGHSTLEMVEQYLDGLNDNAAAEAHNRASPADNWQL